LNEDQYLGHSKRCISKILESLSPKTLISEELPYDPEQLGLTPPFFLLSIGKAAAGMTQSIGKRWKIPAEKTLTLIPTSSKPPQNYPALYGEHPFPGSSSIESTKKVIEKISALPSNTTLIAAISGGTSSLLCSPIYPITLEEKIEVIRALMKGGLPIGEINQVRAALSQVKSGKLLNFFHGTETLSIVLSDTPGMSPYTVGSGPTIPSSLGKKAIANKIFKSLNLSIKLPKQSQQTGLRKKHHLLIHEPIVIGNTRKALEKSIPYLEVANTDTHIWSDQIKGEAQTVGVILSSLILYDKMKSDKNQLFVGAGETTVTLGPSYGKGGRTLELALSLAQTLHDGGICSFVVGALATDGLDGNSGLAGCIIPGNQFRKIPRTRIQAALRSHDTKRLIQNTEWAIKTGPTGTNLNDIFWVFLPGK